MADRGETEPTEPQTATSMQESWVDVQQQEGTLVHSRSKEELEKLLASAASEEEMSDSDTMYHVTFQPSSISPEKYDEEEEEEQQQPLLKVPVPKITQRSADQPESQQFRTDVTASSTRSTCSRLLFCVPVLILTHLAIFGIGYYLGKRMSVEPPTIKLLHV